MPVRSSTKAFLALALGVAVGLALRLLHLDAQTLTHPEFYVPALDIPDFVVTPRARFTIAEVLREALFHDRHPPGYHILMLGWNLNVGTEVFRIRLSSVLAGTLALLAIPFWVRVNGSRGLGLLTVWLLALHGFHIFWSQQARPWVLLGTVGIISSTLLVSLVRRPRALRAIAYGVLAGFGAWIDYYFWPILGAQVLWLAARELDRERAPAALGGVALAAIIAAPMLIYFWLHLTEQESQVGPVGWRDAVRFMQFGGILLRARLDAAVSALSVPIQIIAAVLGTLALALGLPRWTAPPRDPAADGDRTRVLFAVLAAAAVLVTAWTWWAFRDLVGDRKIFRLALAMPFAVVAAWLVAERSWRWLCALARVAPVRALRWLLADPVTAIPLAASAAVVALALVRPVFAPYALISFLPFLVIIAARGIERMGRWRAPAAALTFLIFAASVWEYGTARFSSIEYKGLALQLAARVTPGQAIIMRNTWATAPLTYYLPPDRYRIIPVSHLPGTRPPLGEVPPDTIWIVATGDDDGMIDLGFADLRPFVPGFEPIERISTGSSGALRMVRVRSPGAGQERRIWRPAP
jgi:hypothetical protein